MDPTPAKFTLGKRSSLTPVVGGGGVPVDGEFVTVEEEEEREIDPRVRLMYLANEGDLEGIKELLESATDVNYRDIDDRTALHIAGCQGFTDVAEFLLENGAEVDPKDRWGSTPLADAIHYKNHDVIKLLEKHGAKPLMAPMQVKNSRQVPEYEIDPTELDFTSSVEITKVFDWVRKRKRDGGSWAVTTKRLGLIPMMWDCDRGGLNCWLGKSLALLIGGWSGEAGAGWRNLGTGVKKGSECLQDERQYYLSMVG
ncbi:hypothetical protein U1Q18_010450 [Sarracenia purpurea var. burkii]